MAITALQREKRAEGIGASECAALFGMHRFLSAADLQLIKRGMLEPTPEAPAVSRNGTDDLAFLGSTFEHSTAVAVEVCMGVRLVKPTSTYRHECGVLFANLDRQIEKPSRGYPVVELKESGADVGYGDPGTDQVPEQEFIQVAVQMMCSGATEAHLACRGTGFKRGLWIYHFELTDDMKRLFEILATKVPAWWARHVVNGDPLPEGSPPPSLDILRRIRREPETEVEVPDDLFLEAARATEARKAAEQVEDRAKARLIDALGTADGGRCGAGTVTFFEQTARRIDLDALRTEAPAVAMKFTKPSTTRVLRLKPAKQPDHVTPEGSPDR